MKWFVLTRRLGDESKNFGAIHTNHVVGQIEFEQKELKVKFEMKFYVSFRKQLIFNLKYHDTSSHHHC